ncbi:MAG: YigZ family protein [Paludibacteraceae bacterium]|nr:YigZ family protein [Paludibacteraceae bacterium]
MEQKLPTISKISEGIYKDKGSKFLAFAHHVESVDEAKSIINKYKKEHHKARHVCFAYRIGENAEIYRGCDDGEPSGTAGKPILRQLETSNLTNSMIVVVRYFGGTLLGTGGLVRAYREAAADALKNQSPV